MKAEMTSQVISAAMKDPLVVKAGMSTMKAEMKMKG